MPHQKIVLEFALWHGGISLAWVFKHWVMLRNESHHAHKHSKLKIHHPTSLYSLDNASAHPSHRICLCTSAVTHYGLQPDDDLKGQIESHAQALKAQGLSLTSVFRTDEHGTHNGADFLAQELGIINKTISEYFTSSGNTFGNAGNMSGIHPRAPKIESQCRGHGNIEDHLGKGPIATTCGAIAGVAVGSVNQIVAVVQNKLCVEAGTGHPLPSCKAIVGFIKDSQGPLTSGIVTYYCPDLMSLFTKCKATVDATAHDDKKIRMAAWATQNDNNCKPGKKGDKCIEKSV